MSEKNWVVTLVLCFVGGQLGAHRLYVGKYQTGIFLLLFGSMAYTVESDVIRKAGVSLNAIWMMIDLFTILSGKFRDGEQLLIGKPRSAEQTVSMTDED